MRRFAQHLGGVSLGRHAVQSLAKDPCAQALAEIDIRSLVGYVDFLVGQGLAPTSVGRNLASLSTFFRFLIFDGRLTENVAKLLIAPAVWDRLPTVLGPSAVDRLLSCPEPGDPARTTRPCRARDPVCNRLSGLGSRGLASPRPRLERGFARCVGKGDKERLVPLGERAREAITAYLKIDRPLMVAASAGDLHRVRVANRPAALPDRALADREDPRARRRSQPRRQPAHLETQLRNPPPGRWRRPPRRAGDARARLDRDDAALYASSSAGSAKSTASSTRDPDAAVRDPGPIPGRSQRPAARVRAADSFGVTPGLESFP